MNVELAMRVVELAKASPENFDMRTWIDGEAYTFTKDAEVFVPPCGTTACYAGFVALAVSPAGTAVKGAYVYPPGNTAGRHVETVAIEALDITREQAASLFFLRDISEVEIAVRYLADNPGADAHALWDWAHVPGDDDEDDE